MLNNDVLFSIIIPIYKVEGCLKRCVDSVLNQNIKYIEIILVDDGSPDRCPEICDEYALKDSRIKVIHKVNGGLSDARNSGIDVATGKYIVFVDSDDFITENSLEKIIPFTKDNPDIIVCDGEKIGKTGTYKHSGLPIGETYTGEEFLYHSMLKGNMTMSACLHIYQRKFLIQNNFWFKYGILHEDEEFTPRVFLKANSVIYSGVDFYRNVMREDSITSKKDKRKNLNDLYNTLCSLKLLYFTVKDKKKRAVFLDSLSSKYLSAYYSADAFLYGKSFSRKLFVLNNAKNLKTNIKAVLFCFSPRIYCKINSITKNKNGVAF